VIAGLSVLTVIVLVLSYAALTSVGSGAHQALHTRQGASTSSPNPALTEPAAQETEDETAPGEEPLDVGPPVPNRLLVAISESVLVRATVGTCEAPGTFEISGDGGETWSESEAFAESGATQVLRVLVGGGASSILVVANDAQCEPRLFGTDARADAWYQAGSAGMAWYLDLSSPREIGTPDGLRDVPCEAVSLAAVGSRAALLCADSSVITSSNRGASWSDPTDVPNAVAINVTDSGGYIVALTDYDDCGGIRTATLRDGGLSAPGGCFKLSRTAADDVAVAGFSNVVFVWAGEKFVHSSSGGVE